MKRKTLRTLFLATAAALGLCRSATSALRVDLRVTSVSGPATINHSQSVLVHDVGAQIHLDIWAVINGVNEHLFDEGLTSLTGRMISGPGWFNSESHMRGDLSAELVPSFSGFGSSVGTQVDLDGDGDLDIGSGDDSKPEGFFAVRATSAPNPVSGPEIRIGRVTFNVTSITSSITHTTLAFTPRIHPLAAVWLEDGIARTPLEPNATFFGGATVTVSAIPEPAALGLLAAVSTFASALRPRRKA